MGGGIPDCKGTRSINSQGPDQGCDLQAERNRSLPFDLPIWVYIKRYETTLSSIKYTFSH